MQVLLDVLLVLFLALLVRVISWIVIFVAEYNPFVVWICNNNSKHITGNPDALLRSCVTFAAFSYIMERFSKPQAAIAGSLDYSPARKERRQVEREFSFGVLPPFVLAPSFLETLAFSSRRKITEYTNLKI